MVAFGKSHKKNSAKQEGLMKQPKTTRQKKIGKKAKIHRNKPDVDALRRDIRKNAFTADKKVIQVKPPKRSLLMRTYTQTQLHYLDLMKVDGAKRISYARSRVLMSVMFIIFGLALGGFLHNKYILIGGILFGLGIFWMKGNALKGMYTRYVFQQELAFAKFFSTLAPMLTQVAAGQSLFKVLEKLEPRLDNPDSRKIVRQFMLDLNNNPNSDEPYVTCAQAFSNSPESVTQMLSVAQIVQSNSGMTVVRRLARSSADELMKKVDVIMTAKKRKFFSITTQITMAAMPMIFGIVIGMIIAQMTSLFSSISFG